MSTGGKSQTFTNHERPTVSNHIHPLAVVSPLAELGQDISIGPFCVIEEGVVIGDGCELATRAVVKRGTTLGVRNEIAEGAILGGAPQHAKIGRKYGGVKIGDGNRIRENVTIHAALAESDCTIVGDHNLIMVCAHVAHDCRVGSHTVIVNNVMLGGHVIVEDRAYIGGGSGIHQFCRIGQLAMLGSQSHIVQDVPPFVLIDGATGRVVGLNRVGLRRAGYPEDQLLQLKEAYRIMYRSALTWTEVTAALSQRFTLGPAAEFVPFLKSGKRGFVQERRVPRGATIKLHAADDRGFVDDGIRKVG